MDTKEEFKRLEKQAQQSNYLISEEISFFSLSPNLRVLDAGCGAGVLSAYLISLHFGLDVYAVDQSEIRISQLKEKYKESFQILSEDILKLSFKESFFDRIFCRFVLEHLENPNDAIKEFFRVLAPRGKVCLIDLDGILFNLVTKDLELQAYLGRLQSFFKFDLFIGRKLPLLLKDAGFTDIKWKAVSMNFVGEELKIEIENYRQRFENAKKIFIDALDGEKNYLRFKDLYLSELEKESTLFYTKFLVEGTKP